ncbi:extracellular solute-binding protein, partial [Oscillochloris sp. ZM17-4]|uniref:extracellular solute-binding protein n=1 Tax=Oscillochloris sp. ZM17-4 TaxID=2866714 RepID=UPI001C72B0C2
ALIAGLMAALIAACGQAPAQTSPTAAPAAMADTAAPAAPASGDCMGIAVEPGATLRFQAAGNPTEQQLYIDGAKRFEEACPGVKLTFEPLNDYQTQMKAAFSAGTAPDVFLLDGELMGAFAPNGLLLPLDAAMAAAGVKADDYFGPTLTLYQQDGKTYGLPKDFNPLVVFVNTDIASAAGVDPAAIKTWDDWSAAAAKMTQGDGPGKQYGLCLNSDILRSGALVFQTGNQFIDGGKAVFNDPNGDKAIEFWKSFKDAGTGALYGDLGKGWCGEAFAGKVTAMAVEGGWIVPFLADPANGATDLNYTAIPLPIPAGGTQASWLFTNAIAANAASTYPQAAAAAVLFLTGEANQKALIPSGLAQPTWKSLASDPYYSDNPVAKTLVEAGSYGKLADAVLGGPVKKGDVIAKLNEAQERIFLGTQTVPEAMNQAATEVDAILSR